MSKDLKEYFNKMPRSGALATAGRDGKVNIAYSASAQMIDGTTIFMGCSKNRTLASRRHRIGRLFSDEPHAAPV